MSHRLFVAVNLPVDIKKKIESEIENLKKIFWETDVDIRFLSQENWHLTISFLGYQDEAAINGIIKALEETKPKFKPPIIEFDKIIYGPPGRQPRMIWITGSSKASKELGLIKDELEGELTSQNIRFQRESRLFNAHLTLARFNVFSGTLPKIEKLFNVEFGAKGLDLMESHLKRSGAEYEILSSFDFSGKIK